MKTFSQFISEGRVTRSVLFVNHRHDDGEYTGAKIRETGQPAKNAAGRDITKKPKLIPRYRLQKNELHKTIHSIGAKKRAEVHGMAHNMKDTPPITVAKLGTYNMKKAGIHPENPLKTHVIGDGHHRNIAGTMAGGPARAHVADGIGFDHQDKRSLWRRLTQR